jgi:hypothetical protein
MLSGRRIEIAFRLGFKAGKEVVFPFDQSRKNDFEVMDDSKREAPIHE